MAEVKSGDKIKVHYHGKHIDGETFDSSEGKSPLEFEVGSGSVIKGFDDGVTGMKVGDKKTITVPPEDAYGPYNDEMIISMPKEKLPKDMEVEPGMSLMMSDGKGQQFPVSVMEVSKEEIKLDANHPLAGKELVFDLELVDIESGSPLIITP